MEFIILTVPYSRYTAEPAAAMIAPINHMVNAIPTLPADLKMTLGVAKILSIRRSTSTPAENTERGIQIETDPVPINWLKMRKMALVKPRSQALR